MRGYSLADYHVHPDFSFDAEGSVDDYCQKGLAIGLAEICFTTHYDDNPTTPEKERFIRINGQMHPHAIEHFQAYVDAVAEAHEKYYPMGLSVKCGIEVGYYPGCEERVQKLFEKYPFYYKLGSVHEIGEFNVCYRESVEQMSRKLELNDLADRYFDITAKAVDSGLFDSIGHLDMYKKYGLKYYGEDILTIHRGRIEKVFDLMKVKDIGYEINTAAIRKGHAEYYPSMDIINMARKAGVRMLAIGSDAHKPEHLAYDFEMAASVAYELFPYRGE